MQFVFWVTNDCNLRCDYCYEKNGKNKKYMTPEIAKLSLDLLGRDDEDITIRFHGGEPLLNIPAIEEIQSYANSKFGREKILYSITSNGCVTSQKALDLLVNTMDDISISIDGPPAINDLFRKNIAGESIYQTAINTAMFLQNSVPSHCLNIRMTYNTHTVEKLSNSILHFVSLGFKNIIPAPDLFDSDWTTEYLHVLKEQLSIVNLSLSNKSDICVGGIQKQEIKLRGKCDGGITSFHITPDGSIYPCTYVVGLEEFCIGNIFNGLYTEKINKLSKIYSASNNSCEGCSYLFYCPNNRCKLVNWALTGDYFLPSGVSCAIEQIKLNVSGCL